MKPALSPWDSYYSLQKNGMSSQKKALLPLESKDFLLNIVWLLKVLLKYTSSPMENKDLLLNIVFLLTGEAGIPRRDSCLTRSRVYVFERRARAAKAPQPGIEWNPLLSYPLLKAFKIKYAP